MPRGKLFSYENALVLVLGLTFGVVFLDRGAIGVLMPFIVKDLHLTATQVGLIGGSLSITWAAANFLAGRASDLTGRRKPLLVFALIAFSLCTIGSGLAGTFTALLCARLLMGAAQGPAAPLVMVLAAEGSSPHRRGLNGGLVGTFNPLFAAALGPVLLVALAESFGWRRAFWFAGVPGLVMALVVALVIRETGARSRGGAPEKNGAFPSANPGPVTPGTMRVLDVIRTRNVWVCALCCSCLTGYAALLGVFLPLYLVQVRHIEPAQMGALLSIVGGCTLISGNLLLALSDRVGHKAVVMGAGFASVAAPLGVIFVADSLPVLGVLLGVGFTAMFTMPLLFMAIPAGTVPATAIGTALGFITSVAEIFGSAATPVLAGWMADRWNPGTPFYLAVALSFAWGAGALLLESPREKTNHGPIPQNTRLDRPARTGAHGVRRR